MTLDCRVHYGNARTYVDATKADNDHNVEVGSIVSILDEMWLLTNNGVIANRPKQVLSNCPNYTKKSPADETSPDEDDEAF